MATNKSNRRKFLKQLAGAVSLLTFGLFGKVVNDEMNSNGKTNITIPFSINKKLIFGGNFIIVNGKTGTQVFSSHCTHLGCTLKSEKDSKITCPCHGSEFSLNGEPIKGPAIKPLKKYKFTINNTGDKITIKI